MAVAIEGPNESPVPTGDGRLEELRSRGLLLVIAAGFVKVEIVLALSLTTQWREMRIHAPGVSTVGYSRPSARAIV